MSPLLFNECLGRKRERRVHVVQVSVKKVEHRRLIGDSVGCVASLLPQVWVFSPAGWNFGCFSIFFLTEWDLALLQTRCLSRSPDLSTISCLPNSFFSLILLLLYIFLFLEWIVWDLAPVKRGFLVILSLIFACCIAACSFPIFLSIGLEELEMLDSHILELCLMAAINVIFSTAFLGKIHDEHKDVAVHLKETRRVLRIAVLGLSVLFWSAHGFAQFLYGKVWALKLIPGKATAKLEKNPKPNRSKVSWLLL